MVAASFASASFELLLVADRGTNTVHRFDSVTGAYFGSFGQGYLTDVNDMAVNTATGEAWVLEAANRIYKFDYNTGAYLGTVNLNIGSILDLQSSQAGGFLARSSSTQWRAFSNAGTLTNILSAPTGATFGSATRAANGFFYAVETVGTTITIGHYNALSSRVTGTNFSGTSLDYVQATGNLVADLYTSGGARFSEILNFNPDGSFAGATTSDANLSGIVNLPKASVLGHGSITMVCGINPANAAQGIIARCDPVFATTKGTFGNTILQDPVEMAIVVAPEPGTIAAMGLGAAMLLRKRRLR